ncbi:MAG: hypothetical protein KC900_09305 [Candidatus Omnitrophica bacterium]|nr:hypothetical protein [Candidatus Omnitrophota bacterium]
MKRLTLTMMTVLLAAGCDLAGFKTEAKPVVAKPVLEKIDDEQLAKLILKPKKAAIDVTRDPFEPLIQEERKSPVFAGIPQQGQDLKRFKFLGVFKENDEYVAFLKSGQDKGTYRKDDKLKDFTITKIGPDEVILTNGEQTVTLKRGEAK